MCERPCDVLIRHPIGVRCSSEGCEREQRLRLRHRRRRLGRLRAGQPAERGSRRERAADRGGRARPQSAHPHPARHGQDARAQHVRLGLSHRARAEHERPRGRGDARQGAGRLVVDQRDGLYPRPSRRLRPLGTEGRARLVLCRRAALLQALRELAGWRESVARRFGAGRHRIRAHARSGLRRLARSGESRGLSRDRRLQRQAAGRFRARPIHHPRRLSLLGGDRLSQAGAQARQSRRRDRRACHARAAARHARHRRRICQGQRRHRAGRSRPRGHPLRRRLQHAAAAHALGHRPGRASHRHGDQAGGRPAGRQEPAGSPRRRSSSFSAWTTARFTARCASTASRSA